jgi:hypothetical protein
MSQNAEIQELRSFNHSQAGFWDCEGAMAVVT